jgi:hypothetical protein
VTADTDHTATECTDTQCPAHRPCECPYALVQPHTVARCRYRDTPRQRAWLIRTVGTRRR